jgi:hypothetical protein
MTRSIVSAVPPSYRRASAIALTALLLAAGRSGSADAAGETPAPPNPALAASCRSEAGGLLREQRLEFDRPVYGVRDGAPTVRMAVRIPGQPRDPNAVIEVTCRRDPASGAVDAAIVDAPADDIGPRVIVLGGPPPGTPPRAADPGYRLVVRDPSADRSDGSAYRDDDRWLPGLWVPDFGWRCVGCRSFVVDGSRVFLKRPRQAIGTARVSTNPRFVERRRGSTAPFSSGGIASPTISNFSPKAVRGGGVRIRSGGGAIGAFGR